MVGMTNKEFVPEKGITNNTNVMTVTDSFGTCSPFNDGWDSINITRTDNDYIYSSSLYVENNSEPLINLDKTNPTNRSMKNLSPKRFKNRKIKAKAKRNAKRRNRK